jgi:ParB-like chromosome segregation protein Spo0J
VSGHRRAEAARRAGLTEVPVWPRNYTDEEALIVLVTSNTQSELSPLEHGLHALRALRSGMEITVYAASIRRAHKTVYDEVYAAKVAETVPHVRNELPKIHYKKLVAIHVAPPWLWPALVVAMLGQRWTVKETKARVGRLKDVPADPPNWLSVGFCEGLRSGTVSVDDFEAIKDLLATTAAALQEIQRQCVIASGDDPPEQSFVETTLDQQMGADAASFSMRSDALDYCNGIIESARQRLAEIVQAQAQEQEQNQADDEAEPAPPTTVTEDGDAEAEGSGERSKEFFAARHARRLRRRAKFHHRRIARLVKGLATVPIPPADNLDELLSPRYQASAIRQYLPKALANLKDYEEAINSSVTGKE